MRRRRLSLLLPIAAALPFAVPARAMAAAAELRVLSAGAVEPGLEAAVARFGGGGPPVRVEYATAPRLRERIGGGEGPDLLIAPMGLMAELAAAGRLSGEPVPLGRVGVGVAVRPGAPVPGLRDVESLRRAVLKAESVVFNRASTGLYLERLFERLGLAEAVAPKAHRHVSGAEVMRHLLHGSGREIGFGAITEILLVRELRYVGPLPPEVQNHTTYAASLLPGAAPGAEALLRHLAGPEGRAAFDAAGIEAVLPVAQ